MLPTHHLPTRHLPAISPPSPLRSQVREMLVGNMPSARSQLLVNRPFVLRQLKRGCGHLPQHLTLTLTLTLTTDPNPDRNPDPNPDPNPGPNLSLTLTLT